MVMLPVSLAYGVATGLGPVAGLYGAIAVGFFAAVFGGTRSQISGPTGPMTVVLVAVGALGLALGEVVAAVIVAGLMQILMGALRVGSVGNEVPESVISGFMTGIGIFVILFQIAPFAGHDPVLGGIINVIVSLPATIENVNPQAIIVAGVTLLTAFLWPAPLRRYLPARLRRYLSAPLRRYLPARLRRYLSAPLRRYLPAPLAAMAVGSIVALAVAPVASLLWPQAPALPVIGGVPTGWPEWRLPDWNRLDRQHPEFALAVFAYTMLALKLALVGSIDSLMNARMADSMNARMANGLTRPPHRPNRELIAQGIGNVAAGFIGGLPGSANTAATVINIRSGGGRIAGVFCALILLALVLSLGPLVKNIPIAVLAGVLIKVGWDLIDWKQLLEFARPVRRRYLLLIMFNVILTLALVLLFDSSIRDDSWMTRTGIFPWIFVGGIFCATYIGMGIPLIATHRRKAGFPWVRNAGAAHDRQEYYELSLMTLTAVLTVFDVLGAAVVGLAFSTLIYPPRQTSDDAHGSSDGVG